LTVVLCAAACVAVHCLCSLSYLLSCMLYKHSLITVNSHLMVQCSCPKGTEDVLLKKWCAGASCIFSCVRVLCLKYRWGGGGGITGGQAHLHHPSPYEALSIISRLPQRIDRQVISCAEMMVHAKAWWRAARKTEQNNRHPVLESVTLERKGLSSLYDLVEGSMGMVMITNYLVSITIDTRCYCNIECL
jgi:hypothetical protein